MNVGRLLRFSCVIALTLIVGTSAFPQNRQSVPNSRQILIPPVSTRTTDGAAPLALPATANLQISASAINAAFGGLLKGQGQLYRRSGDITFAPNDWIDPSDAAQSITFEWNVNDVPNATGVVWQVSRVPFAPTLSVGLDPLKPAGLVASGAASGRSASFTVDFASLAEQLGLKAKPVRAKPLTAPQRSIPTPPQEGTPPSNNEAPNPFDFLRNLPFPQPQQQQSPPASGTTAASTQTIIIAPTQMASPQVRDFVVRGGTVPFFVRILPVMQETTAPLVVGFPSETGKVLYGKRPPRENPFAASTWVPREIPQLQLVTFSYLPYRMDTHYPAGCKVFTGSGYQQNPLEFLLGLWDWAAATFGKIKGWAVDFVVAIVPILPKDVVALALDTALVAAGVPPNIPNLGEIMDQGAGYLAQEVAGELVGPVGSEITKEIAGEVLSGPIGDMAADELNRRVRAEVEQRVKSGLVQSADNLRAEIEANASDTTCMTKEYTPVVTFSVKNLTDKPVDDVELSISDDAGVFAEKLPTINLGPRESMTLSLPLYPDLWAIASRYNVSLYDAMKKHYEIYNMLPSRFRVSGPDIVGCYEFPDGTQYDCKHAGANAAVKPLSYATDAFLLKEAFTKTN